MEIVVSKLYKTFKLKRKMFNTAGPKYRTAVDDVSFNVKPGIIFALLGPNGSGKTTIIRMLSNALVPTSGSIYYDGVRLEGDSPEIRKNIAVVSQINILDGNLSIYDNILQYYLLRLYSQEVCEEKTETVIAEYDLEKYRYDRVFTLSGGYRRRIEIGQAIEDDAQVIFMDEPTTGLDPISRAYVWTRIKEARQRGKTIFLTTHLLREAEELADYVAFLRAGKIVIDRSKEDLREIFAKNIIEVRLDGQITDDFIEAHNILDYHENTFRMFLSKDEDISSIIKAFLDQGIRITSFTEVTPTVEDMYFEIMRN